MGRGVWGWGGRGGRVWGGWVWGGCEVGGWVGGLWAVGWPRALQSVVKRWSNGGQTVVKRRTSGGQSVAKAWQKRGQTVGKRSTAVKRGQGQQTLHAAGARLADGVAAVVHAPIARVPHGAASGPTAVQQRSKAGPTAVKRWSNDGPTAVKRWQGHLSQPLSMPLRATSGQTVAKRVVT